MATNLSLTVAWDTDTGVLSIDGTTTAQNYQDFLRTVRYVIQLVFQRIELLWTMQMIDLSY